MEFSKRLIQLREKKGLTQLELAKQLGISRSAVSLWELGKREPDHEMLEHLADFFNISIDYLLGRTNTHGPTGKAAPDFSTPAW